MTNLPLPTEAQEQIAFCEWLDLKHIAYFHVPNSTWTKSIQVKLRNKRMGVKKGVPDLFIFIPKDKAKNPFVDNNVFCNLSLADFLAEREKYSGLYKKVVIEMKRKKGGCVSEDQDYWLRVLAMADFEVAICKGADEAIEFVERYL
ncbi:MAG: VRR-NUC domain-containing protein [Pseudomonadales bacterium]|jgi:hypothetical protein|nr:VRR-NUC domain-containing protein [Pseudomonadales bacterium]